MFKIKQQLEDFVVREVMDLEMGEGKYSYYKLWKKSYTTQKAVDTVARALKKRNKFINFAGTKDKYGITEQFISISLGPERNLDLGDIKLEFLGRGRERLNLGSLEGNDFEIVVRNIDNEEAMKLEQAPNYFDEQRFGSGMNNHIIGKHIIKREFREACKLIPETHEYLKKHPSDFVNALRLIPKRTLWLYPNSYQSYLWNRAVSMYISKFKHVLIETPMGRLAVPLERIPEKEIEIPGSENSHRGFDEILEEEGIDGGDFHVRGMPEFFLKGDKRAMFMDVRNLEIGKPEKDELNSGKKKILMKFFLGKGSYATMLVKCMFS